MIHKMALGIVALAFLVVAGCGVGPDAPSGLTVTSTAPITLNWSSVSGATSYNVYRGTATGGLSTKTLLSSNVTLTTFTDTTATVGTTYFYQVTAVSADGESSPSNEVTAAAQTQSGSSIVLIGTGATTQITLNWSNVVGAVSYNLYRGTTSSIITSKTRIATGITVQTFADTAITSTTTFFYQVTAVNSTGIEFQVSNEVSASI